MVNIALLDSIKCFHGLIYEEELGKNYTAIFNSMEQLWLAFVMKEKFDKVWNGEDWEGA